MGVRGATPMHCGKLCNLESAFCTLGSFRFSHCVLFLFFLLNIFFIYWAALGLSCGTQDLWSLLRHVESLVVACELIVVACRMYFPLWPEMKPRPSALGVQSQWTTGEVPVCFLCYNRNNTFFRVRWSGFRFYVHLLPALLSGASFPTWGQ